MKYRKRPVVIEAFQMTLERRRDNSEWPAWLHDAWGRGPGEGGLWIDPAPGSGDEAMMCGTLEGVYVMSWGDWLIRGVEGEIYPCKPDIFAKTYDPV